MPIKNTIIFVNIVRSMTFSVVMSILSTIAPIKLDARQCQTLFVDTDSNVSWQQTVNSNDWLIEQAISLNLAEDYKLLTDLVPKRLSPVKRQKIISETKGLPLEQKISHLIENLFESKTELLASASSATQPQFTLTVDSVHKRTFDYIEKVWDKLIRRTPKQTESSLIPLPFDLLIPGSRFQESYYWDSFFASQALLMTGRSHLVYGQIENFIYLINIFGFVPNGNRKYYLSRSQPPMLSRMVRVYLEHQGLHKQNIKWLRDKVLPALEKEYAFWMSDKRFDIKTNLNHHYDDLNIPRPERHSADMEELLGETYRDVRAEAESGKDFTIAYEGQASHMAGVLLNSILFGMESDLAWISGVIGEMGRRQQYQRNSDRRKLAVMTYLWNPTENVFYDYNLRTRLQSRILTADTFVPLYMEMLPATIAQTVASNGLTRLEAAGGIMSSEINSGKQWDAPYGWAPHILFTIDGLRKTGLQTAAIRIAKKWIEMVDKVYLKRNTIFEKYDVFKADAATENGDKYPTQEGFLWTNGVYVWILGDVLKIPLLQLAKN